MKVFLITSGEYSDYCVNAVSLDEEDAERKCAILNTTKTGEFCEIEVFDTDDLVVDTKEEVRKKFSLCVETITGDIRWFTEECLTFENCSDIRYRDLFIHKRGYVTHIEATATLPKCISQDKAKKILLDRIAKFKAERQIYDHER